ncbi:TAXI family TRAP transporter solute-binding subunit [Oscillibacter sp.]|jgi:TRAP transporter TAXI family solute receptor|uniref:TAXI family TRAP transporter solute-binding subunit n=1 Tax=Oscillibacter sp. TaxID=1945593 RepID=UPI00216D7611|nr:TAXI family TRAP transporter solute-binding subunit [Oscillibacter sp.]MCI9649985.1 TAXI family TRAP transporter solute-binding subunit [Oscillibacter sp.]
MKKVFALILTLAMALSLAACGGDNGSSQPANTDAPANTEAPADSGEQSTEISGNVDLTFAAQEVGTAAYNYAAAIQTAIVKEIPGANISITTTSPGGVGAPVIVNGGAQCDIVMSNSAPAKWSMEEGILGNAPTPDICAIAGGLGHDFVNVMFTQKFVDATGITTVEELVAQKYPVKLVIKTNGTFGELAAEKVFEALGVTLEDVASWGGVVEKTGGDAIKSGLQDDLYDMTIDHIGAGQANTSELCLTHDMYDVQLGEETMAKMVEMGYDYVTVEANTWNGQTEEIKTVGSQQVILVPTSLDYAVAYHMAKAVCENKADLASAVAAMSYFDPETAGTLTLTGVPLHPGAAAYYEEMGYAHG